MLVLSLPLTAQAPPAARPADPATELYAGYCAACHGDAMEGGRGPSLVGNRWTYGGDEAAVVMSIRDGRSGGDMPAFGAVLSGPQIRTLALLIRDRASRVSRQEAQKPVTVAVNGVVKTELESFKIETVAEGLVTPWGLDFFPDGRILVSERNGQLRIIDKGKLLPPVEGVPTAWQRQDGGYFDIAVHPDYAENGWVYLGYSAPGPNNTSLTEPGPDNTSATRVVRGRIENNRWTNEQAIYEPPAEWYTASNVHYGLRFLFDDQNNLFFSIGDRGRADLVQDLSQPVGKLFRVTDDGKVPEGNPFAGRPGAMPEVWSYGHRNTQGLAFDPVSGKLWETEHGPRGGDEINIVYPGHNYGWPVVSFGILDNRQAGSGMTTEFTTMEGMDDPVTHYSPSPGISPFMFYTGDKFPRWKNQPFVGVMRGEELKRLVLDNDKYVREEVIFEGLGRVRDIVTGPDGFIYIALQEPGPSVSATTPGSLIRLVPAK